MTEEIKSVPQLPIPDYADVLTVSDFAACVHSGCFVNDDGSGYYANPPTMTRIPAYPSDFRECKILEGYTHVAWFNK